MHVQDCINILFIDTQQTTDNDDNSSKEQQPEEVTADAGGSPSPDDGENQDLEPEISVDPAVIEKLSLATLEMFLPNLQKAKSALNDVL